MAVPLDASAGSLPDDECALRRGPLSGVSAAPALRAATLAVASRLAHCTGVTEGSSSGPPRVSVRVPGQPLREVRIADGATLGRDDDNAVVMDHPSISRHHARLEKLEDGVFELRDLGSLNGARLNGQSLRDAAPIYHGDRFSLGDVELVFLYEAGERRSHETDHALHALRGAAETANDSVEREDFGVLLACDVPACATLAQQLSGQRVQEWVDAWWEEVASLLDRHGADVDPTPRDARLAYWSIAHRDAPSSEVNVALRAALELFDVAEQHRSTFGATFGAERFEVSLGVHLGAFTLEGAHEPCLDATVGGAPDVALRLAALKSEAPCAAIVSWNVARWAAFGFRFHNIGELALPDACDEAAIACLGLDPAASS